MTRPALRLDGGAELQQALKNMSKEIAQEVDEFVMETAANIEAGIKLRIQSGPKTGRIYTRGNVTHQASAPGQAPASDTGELIGSIQNEREGVARAAVVSRLDKTSYLEFGTQRIAQRPAWLPELEQTRPEFVSGLDAILAKVVR